MNPMLFLTFLICALCVQLAWRQIPQTMSYQGLLTDAANNRVPDGNYSLTFKIYDVSTGGTELWTESHPTVAVKDGILRVILGSSTPLNINFNKSLWIGVKIGEGSELSPRMELTSTPYSLGSQVVPQGAIIMWSGSPASIPSGWQLCDGTNGSPDLRNRFIVGAGSSYSVGNVGGANTVALSVTEMPAHDHGGATGTDSTSHGHGAYINDTDLSHSHSVGVEGPGWFPCSGGYGTNNEVGRCIGTSTAYLNHNHSVSIYQTSVTHSHTISSQGGGAAHENRPPYYALCFIIKL